MGKLVDNLRKYFKETPQEQIEKDWEEVEHLNNVGPSVDKYLEYIQECENYIDRRTD